MIFIEGDATTWKDIFELEFRDSTVITLDTLERFIRIGWRSWTLAIITKTNLVLTIGVGQVNLLGLPLMIIICRAIIDGVGTVCCKVNIAVLADDVVCNRDCVASHPTRVILGQIEGLLGGDDVNMIG
jgi:hypothetical protein